MAHPYTGSEPYCFVSYSHKDLALAEPWLDGLGARGCRIWFDEGIDPGTEWAEGIAERLEGASAYLVLLSSNAVESVYVRSEISRAIALKKPILCVYLEPCELSGGMKLQLGIFRAIYAYHYKDGRKAQEIACAALPSSIQEQCESASQSDPLPEAPMEPGPREQRRVRSLQPSIWIVLVLAAALAIGLLSRSILFSPDPASAPTETPQAVDPIAEPEAETPEPEEETPEPEEEAPEPVLLTDAAQIDKAGEEKLCQIMEGVIAKNVESSWSQAERLKKSEYVGFYLLTPKSGADSVQNRLILVYRNVVNIVIPAENVDKTLGYYYTLSFENVQIEPDGALIPGEGQEPQGRVNADVPGHSFYYAGYKGRIDLYTALVEPFLGTFDVTKVGDLS